MNFSISFFKKLAKCIFTPLALGVYWILMSPFFIFIILMILLESIGDFFAWLSSKGCDAVSSLFKEDPLDYSRMIGFKINKLLGATIVFIRDDQLPIKKPGYHSYNDKRYWLQNKIKENALDISISRHLMYNPEDDGYYGYGFWLISFKEDDISYLKLMLSK